MAGLAGHYHHGVAKWLFGVDESGGIKSPYYGFGALIMRWERRGEFSKAYKAILSNHPHHLGEVKWKKTNNAASYDLALELVDFFFKRRFMFFHCIVIKKALIKKSAHADYDEAWRKNLCMFLVDKAKRCGASVPGGGHAVHVWADDLPSRYAKAAEALEVVANRKLARSRGQGFMEMKVFEHDSKKNKAIQLADLLAGPIVKACSGKASTGYKAKLQDHIAGRLGWDSLCHGTFQKERKFNIWHLHDQETGVRSLPGQRLQLHWPLG